MNIEKATFGAGCFWGVEESFRTKEGVIETAVGYSGGHTENPSYEEVCSKKSGHAEVLQISFDKSLVSYESLLELFWSIHNPTTLNRQGPDIGSQYRSVIFTHNEDQRKIAEDSKTKHQKGLDEAIVTEITPAPEFYKAEDYHQQYLMKRGGGACHL